MSKQKSLFDHLTCLEGHTAPRSHVPSDPVTYMINHTLNPKSDFDDDLQITL